MDAESWAFSCSDVFVAVFTVVACVCVFLIAIVGDDNVPTADGIDDVGSSRSGTANADTDTTAAASTAASRGVIEDGSMALSSLTVSYELHSSYVSLAFPRVCCQVRESLKGRQATVIIMVLVI